MKILLFSLYFLYLYELSSANDYDNPGKQKNCLKISSFLLVIKLLLLKQQLTVEPLIFIGYILASNSLKLH